MSKGLVGERDMEAVMDDDGGIRGQLPETVRWLERLVAVWQDQRGGAAVPDAQELFLADMAEMIPHLLLAYRDEETDEFEIEFAGAAARALLPLEPLGVMPERCPAEHPLAWLGTGFARVRRPAVPGLLWMRAEGLVGLFLPYGGFDGRVTLVLAGIARWSAGDDSTVVPLRPGRAGKRGGPG